MHGDYGFGPLLTVVLRHSRKPVGRRENVQAVASVREGRQGKNRPAHHSRDSSPVPPGPILRRRSHAIPAASALEAQETLTVAGLERPVEITVDRWGISHIYAQTERDLFFAQGFNAARDRLFQLEIWRRR